jgi:DHA2 family multidrug resistance protein
MTTAATLPIAHRETNKWMIAVGVSLGALVEVIDISIVDVALPAMQTGVGTTVDEIGWVVTSYAIANVVILPLTAWLGERFGKKRYFLWSLVAFTASSLLCGLAHTLPVLILARVLQGIGGGGLLAKGQAILFESFPKEEHAMAQSLFGAIVIAGPAIGPTLGGFLVTNVGWRWIFFVNLPIGLLATLMCAAFLPPDGRPKRRGRGIDWASLLLLVAGLGALQTVLEEGQSHDWLRSPFIVVFSLVALMGTTAFVWRQLGRQDPIVDLRVLRYRSLWAGSLLSIVLGIVLYGVLVSVPIFVTSIMGYSSQQAGMLLLPSAIASAVALPIAARLVDSFDVRLLVLAGLLALVGSAIHLSHLTGEAGSGDLFWPLIERATGTVLMFLPLSVATLGAIPKRDLHTASGLFNLTRQLGGSVGVAILTTVLAQRQAFHRYVLVERLGAIRPEVAERLSRLAAAFEGGGVPAVEAPRKALAAVDAGVNLQSAVMAFADCYRVIAMIVFSSLPLILLLRKPGKGTKIEMSH